MIELAFDRVLRVYGAPPNVVRALGPVTFDVHAGELVAVMGLDGVPIRAARLSSLEALESVGLRELAGARAAYLALLGCVLAVPAGAIPAWSLFSSVNIPFEFVIPWGHLAAIVCGLPIVGFAAAWSFAGRSRVPRSTEVAA